MTPAPFPFPQNDVCLRPPPLLAPREKAPRRFSFLPRRWPAGTRLLPPPCFCCCLFDVLFFFPPPGILGIHQSPPFFPGTGGEFFWRALSFHLLPMPRSTKTALVLLSLPPLHRQGIAFLFPFRQCSDGRSGHSPLLLKETRLLVFFFSFSTRS